MKTEIDSALTETLLYHEQTKHHFHRYARSAGYLDWANQPNPFRCYEGVTAVRLPLQGQEHRVYLGGRNLPEPAKPSAPFWSYRSDFRPGSPFLETRGLCG
jgi:hypothetical protein